MKTKILIGILGSMISISNLSAFDYDFFGGAYAFSKIGFNDNLDLANGKYPTDSWASIGLEANVAGSFVEGFTYGLGAMLSAPVWDKTYRGEYPSRAYINGTVRRSSNGNQLNDTRNNFYFISLAYLGYEYKNDILSTGIKAGRYLDHGLDWFSGSSEGAHLWIGNENIKFQLNFVNRRGLAYNQWFNDFYIINSDINSANYATRYFIVGAFDLKFDNFAIKPQIWYHRNDYIAPGINAFYEYKGESFSAKTSLLSLFVLSHKTAQNTYKYINGTNKRLGAILILQEDMAYNNWSFGGGVWKNFGNPNGNNKIGTHGSLAKIDVWTSSAFTFGTDGWALNDANAEDVFNLWLYGGHKINDFKWEVLGRITTSRASNEQSLALNLEYNLTKQIILAAKLEYFYDLSKNDLGEIRKLGFPINKSSVANDRSHIFLSAAYTW